MEPTGQGRSARKWIPVNKAMFHGDPQHTPAELDQLAAAGSEPSSRPTARPSQERVVTGSVSDALSPGSPSMLSLLFLAR